jgi:phage shock protein A
MFGRIVNLMKGFLGLFVSGLEKANPEALLEVEKENLRTQVARYNEGLAAHAGLCERLMSQVKKLEADERDLRARTAANLKAGNRDTAGQNALRLQTVKRELDENRRQLAQAEETYKSLVSAREVAVKAARAKIEALRQGLDDLKVKRAMAELTEMASGMVSELGGPADTLDRLHTMVEEEREKAAGRVRVARDTFDGSAIEMKEAEQQALADQALADFAATEGLALEPREGAIQSEAAPPAAKTMGPIPGKA